MKSSNSSSKIVSVVVPAYNEQELIGRCIDALLGELEKNDELIIVNNNSTDMTAEIVTKYAKKDERVVLVTENRQGTMFARKTGFDMAKGDYLATVDSDSVVLRGWCEGMISGIEELKVDAASSFGSFDFKHIPRTNHFLTNKILFTAFPFMLGVPAFLFGSNMMMKRGVWLGITNKVRLEKRIWDDVEITLLAYKDGSKLGIIKKPLFKFSARRSLDSLQEIYDYTKDGRYTLSNFSAVRADLLLILIFFTMGLVIIILKPLNYFTGNTKSD